MPKEVFMILIMETANIKLFNEKNYKKMIGNGCYIMKPQTELTTEWYDSMIQKMDNVYENLKKNLRKK